MPSHPSLRTRMTLAFLVLVTSLVSGASAQTIPDPVPDPSTISIFSGGIPLFDPLTHAFASSGRIEAVQFPGERISQNDPLVTEQSILSITGTFTGSALFPLSDLDRSGVFNDLTTQVTVNGVLVYSDFFPTLQFDNLYQTPHGFIVDWLGERSVTFIDTHVISSPFLDLWFATVSHDMTEKGTVSEVLDAKGNVIKYDTDSKSSAIPEPTSLTLLGIASLCALVYSQSRRATLGRGQSRER